MANRPTARPATNVYAAAVAPTLKTPRLATAKKNHPHANLGAYLHKSKKAR